MRAQIAAATPEERAEMSAVFLQQVDLLTAPDPWVLGFTITLSSTGTVIGSCGFKGPPDPDGTVEIAYGIAPEHQGNGFATEAVDALVRFALEDPRVTVIRAHTFEAQNPSTRVLEKCGFQPRGAVIDPEGGSVWRWEIR
jgi:RimJ/RimL family protein N-acetyltransferase